MQIYLLPTVNGYIFLNIFSRELIHPDPYYFIQVRIWKFDVETCLFFRHREEFYAQRATAEREVVALVAVSSACRSILRCWSRVLWWPGLLAREARPSSIFRRTPPPQLLLFRWRFFIIYHNKKYEKNSIKFTSDSCNQWWGSGSVLIRIKNVLLEPESHVQMRIRIRI